MTEVCTCRRFAIVLAILLLLGAVSGFAQHAAKGDSEVGVSGQQVAKDPATGKFRAPTPEELKILAPLTQNDSHEGLEQRTLPNGAVVMDLQGRFQNYSLATKDSNGSVRLGCVTNKKEAEQFLTGKSSATKKVNEKIAPVTQSDPSTWEVK